MFGKLVLALAASTLFASAAPVEQTEQLEARKTHTGQATYFSVGLGACGWNNVDSDYIVALNIAQWEANGMNSDGWSSKKCGQSLAITNQNNGKTVIATVADECPTCSWGSLDMSPGLFSALNDGDMDAGVFPISWNFKKRA